MRLPRFLPCLLVLSLFAALLAPPVWAQDAAAKDPLRQNVDDFWHYAKVARYDLAAAEGQKLLTAAKDPVKLLETLESVAAQHRDNLEESLLRWQNVASLRDISAKLLGSVAEAYRIRRADPKVIEDNINRLSVNEPAYLRALARLRESGELAVPQMIDRLRDANAKDHAIVRRALRELGKPALNPLLAATEMKDFPMLVTVVATLGDMGYDIAQPYLLRLVQDKDTPAEVKTAATQALNRIGLADASKGSAAVAFYQLAEKYYYGKAAVAADPRSPVNYVWYWDDQKGLLRKEVPPAIFDELMAMRACEYALKLDAAQADAVSLWLAANYKREAELPAGAKDPTRADGQPDAHYYGVSAGTRYLSQVLARALNDRNSAVALRSIKSLQQVAGQNNLLGGPEGRPVIAALQYPDRLVRFEAAFALAGALPQKNFEGQSRVPLILAEAVAQTGKTSVLVAAADDNRLNTLVGDLKKAGFNAAGGTGADAALSAAAGMPSVDILLISEDLKASEIDRILQQAGSNPRLEAAARVIQVKTSASPFADRAVNNPMLSVTAAADVEGLKSAFTAAQQKAGALAVDEKMASDYAVRAAELLARLAISRGQVLDLNVTRPTLLAALNDARPQVVKSAGQTLALLGGKDAQAGLLAKATADATAEDVKVSLYQSLATSAKFFGNQLDEAGVAAIQKAVESEKSATARSAAAEARGALNLPADQARTLIVKQSKV